MDIVSTDIKDCVILIKDKYEDSRGWFQETYNQEKFNELDVPSTFVQDNQSFSKQGVLRGIHTQRVSPQGKLVSCDQGLIYDVCVDLRPDSPTYMKHFGIHLSPDNNYSLYIPPGCGHGFLSLKDSTVSYKCTSLYHKESDGGIVYDDITLNINWPRCEVPLIISEKDLSLPTFEEWKVGNSVMCGAV